MYRSALQLLQKNPSRNVNDLLMQILAEKMKMLLEFAVVIWEECDCSLLIEVRQPKYDGGHEFIERLWQNNIVAKTYA